MDHIAIDLGSRESQVCIRDEAGNIIEECRLATTGLGKYLAGKTSSRVVVESCAEGFSIADQARAAKHEVVVVPSTLARTLGVGQRGIKNDQRDARSLSSASCRLETMPSVHIPSEASRETKAMCAMREGLVESRTKLINTARSWLRTYGVGVLKGGTAETFPSKYRIHVARKGKSVPVHVEGVLKAIETLNEQVVAADEDLAKRANADPVCRLLMTTPGVGPVTAMRFRSAVDDVTRFSDAHALESYLGLTPGEDSSGNLKKITGITKAGAPKVRWALTQAAWTAMRCRRQDPMVEWGRQVQQRRGKGIGTIALVRKMAGVLYAMWRDGKPYDPWHEEKRRREKENVVTAPTPQP